MRKSDACPTKYFRAADLPADWELTAEIEMARLETFEGDRGKGDTEKLVVYFRKQKSGLVCGPVLWDQIIEATDEEDSDNWPGHFVQLYRTMTQFGSKTVPCVRVREAPDDLPPKKPAKKSASKSAPMAKPEYDDEIPV
jgi:hypothetical protein